MCRAIISLPTGHHASCQVPLETHFSTVSQAVPTMVYSRMLLNTLFWSVLRSLVMTVPSPPGTLTSFSKLNLFTSPKREVCLHLLCSGSNLSSSFSWAKSICSCPIMSYRVVILPNSLNSSSSSATDGSLSPYSLLFSLILMMVSQILLSLQMHIQSSCPGIKKPNPTVGLILSFLFATVCP